MTRRPPLLTLLASLIVHGGALAILFFLPSGESHPGALFVDLETLSEREAAAVVSARKPAAAEGGVRRVPAGSARPVERDADQPAPASSPAPSTAESPSAVTPAPSPAPEPARKPEAAPMTPPEPRQPEPAVAVPAREAAPDGVAGSSASASPVEVRTNPGSAAGERAGSASAVGRGVTQGPGTPGQSAGGAGVGVALAPSGPSGGAPGAEYGSYLANVRRLIQETLRYPPPARRRGLKGTVYLEIFIKPDGAISAVSVASSSSHPLLDEAALEAVRSLAPQPFPKGLVPRPLRVRLPVVFDLQ